MDSSTHHYPPQWDTRTHFSQFQPRQFEFPLAKELQDFVAVGTVDGRVFVGSHRTGNILGTSHRARGPGSILALSWLHSSPTWFATGNSNGDINLVNATGMLL